MHLRSHLRRRLSFKWAWRMKRICRYQKWTAKSINYLSRGCPFRPWTILLRSFVLMLMYLRNVATPKCYQKTSYCLLTQTLRHYNCHHLPLHIILIERSSWHKILPVWSWLLATCCNVSITFSLHTGFKILGQFYIKYWLLNITFEVGGEESTTRYVFQEILSVATVATKAAQNVVHISWCAPLNSSDDELNYKRCRWCSSSPLDHPIYSSWLIGNCLSPFAVPP